MKTTEDFRKLASEVEKDNIAFDSLTQKDVVVGLADLLQTVYEAGVSDERNTTIEWLKTKHSFWALAVIDKLRSFAQWKCT